MMQKTKTIADFVRIVGLSNLCNFDGCVCSDFSVRGVSVTIGCRKGNGYPDYSGWGIKVDHGGGDYDTDELTTIAMEVFNQLREPHSEAYARISCQSMGQSVAFDISVNSDGVVINNQMSQSRGNLASL